MWGKIGIYLFLIILVACNSNSKTAEIKVKEVKTKQKGYPKFEFKKTIHNFGKLTQGEIIECAFKFKNIGTANLIISKVEMSCGCTDVKYDKKPIPPNAERYIKVKFDSSKRLGKQYKSITLISNTLKQVQKLYVSANIKNR